MRKPTDEEQKAYYESAHILGAVPTLLIVRWSLHVLLPGFLAAACMVLLWLAWAVWIVRYVWRGLTEAGS